METHKPFILGINGSPHKDGIVMELLSLTLGGAEQAGAETQIVHLYDLSIVHAPGYYSEDPEKEVPASMPKDDIVALYPEILRADGLVLATPVYWANMSAVMKDFVEHMTALENEHHEKLAGKIAAFIAASKENEGGVEMAAMSMVAAFGQMGMLIPPNGIMWHPGLWVTSKDHLDWAKEDAPVVGRNMVTLAQLLKKNPISWEA